MRGFLLDYSICVSLYASNHLVVVIIVLVEVIIHGYACVRTSIRADLVLGVRTPWVKLHSKVTSFCGELAKL